MLQFGIHARPAPGGQQQADQRRCRPPPSAVRHRSGRSARRPACAARRCAAPARDTGSVSQRGDQWHPDDPHQALRRLLGHQPAQPARFPVHANDHEADTEPVGPDRRRQNRSRNISHHDRRSGRILPHRTTRLDDCRPAVRELCARRRLLCQVGETMLEHLAVRRDRQASARCESPTGCLYGASKRTQVRRDRPAPSRGCRAQLDERDHLLVSRDRTSDHRRQHDRRMRIEHGLDLRRIDVETRANDQFLGPARR